MPRTIKIENTSGSSNMWVGKQFAVNEVYEILERRIPIWFADPAVLADIDAGNLKLIKVDSPVEYYTIAEAQKIYGGASLEFITGGTAGQLLTANTVGDMVWTPIVGGAAAFFTNGSADNKWLNGDGDRQTSNKSPVILADDAVVYALTFTNRKDNADIDIEIYKNASLYYTWSLTDKRYAYKSNGLSALAFSAGDRMSVFVKSTGLKPVNPTIAIYFSFLNANPGEGGGATL